MNNPYNSFQIEDKGNKQVVTAKKNKSVILVILLSIFAIQLTIGIIMLPFQNSEPTVIKIVIPVIYFLILLPVLRSLLWQVMGKHIITIREHKIEFEKKGDIFSKMLIVDRNKIDIRTKDNETSIGPLAMLQILKISSPAILKIYNENGKRITSIGCRDIMEANHLKNLYLKNES